MSSERAAMAPLDLDKYAEIAKVCKYLPENDLKVTAGSPTAPVSRVWAWPHLQPAVRRSFGASISLLQLTVLACCLGAVIAAKGAQKAERSWTFRLRNIPSVYLKLESDFLR